MVQAERNTLLAGGAATVYDDEHEEGPGGDRKVPRTFRSVGLYIAVVAAVGALSFVMLAGSNGDFAAAIGGGGGSKLGMLSQLTRGGSTRTVVDKENPPRGFEGWKGAPMWDDVEEIPVLFTKGADEADLVVVGHSTDLNKNKYFLASLHKHGIHAALSGNGTKWHWFEDKLMVEWCRLNPWVEPGLTPLGFSAWN